MTKTYIINQHDTLKSIVAKHVAKGASKKDIETATLAILETNPQLDVMKPKNGMKLTIPNGAVSISPRTMERYRVNQAWRKVKQIFQYQKSTLMSYWKKWTRHQRAERSPVICAKRLKPVTSNLFINMREARLRHFSPVIREPG